MILKDSQLNELELSNLLKSCGKSMQTLKITGPGHKLAQQAFCQVLQGCMSPDLECLTLKLIYVERSYDPPTSPGLLDMVFKSPTALQKLKTLSLLGRLETGSLFKLFPKSLVKLSWELRHLPTAAFLKALSSSRGKKRSLCCNLKCCSVLSCYGWDNKEEMAVERALESQGVFFHSILNQAHGLPTATDELHENGGPFPCTAGINRSNTAACPISSWDRSHRTSQDRSDKSVQPVGSCFGQTVPIQPPVEHGCSSTAQTAVFDWLMPAVLALCSFQQ
ncbi:hypothetical protein PCANC_16359 [Puccinia coronata f. sp. avenae]|uniref:Uncharacterized protein n=1 Tax=Puccinia coronata f. sp. avenae TaxID=200324 RepID=A0A2N5UR11_9BASI|nr:hypothetical protein PCANC_16359 [Puccinia coronata f. sp. avenae]